ncbi:MAG: hypothetical protein KBT36_12430 [Kurthia sp.]|nr:hypothetical protein [Candidatus Kurthia equi]
MSVKYPHHQVTISTVKNSKNVRARGEIIIHNKFAEFDKTAYTIFSTQVKETAENAKYYVQLETIPTIDSLKGLEFEELQEIVYENLEVYHLDDLFINSSDITALIYLASQSKQDISFEISTSNLIMPLKYILIDHKAVWLAYQYTTVGLTILDILSFAELLEGDWSIINEPIPYIRDLMQGFNEIDTSLTMDQKIQFKNLQRALLMDDDSTVINNEVLMKSEDTELICVHLVDDLSNKYYRLLQVDHIKKEAEIIAYALYKEGVLEIAEKQWNSLNI